MFDRIKSCFVSLICVLSFQCWGASAVVAPFDGDLKRKAIFNTLQKVQQIQNDIGGMREHLQYQIENLQKIISGDIEISPELVEECIALWKSRKEGNAKHAHSAIFKLALVQLETYMLMLKVCDEDKTFVDQAQ